MESVLQVGGAEGVPSVMVTNVQQGDLNDAEEQRSQEGPQTLPHDVLQLTSDSYYNNTYLERQSAQPKDQLCGVCSKLDFQALLMACGDIENHPEFVDRGTCYLADVQTTLASKNCPLCRLVSSCIRSYPEEVLGAAEVMLHSRPYDVRLRRTETHQHIREAWLGRIEVVLCQCHLLQVAGSCNYQVGSLLPVKEENGLPQVYSNINGELFSVREPKDPIFARQIPRSVDLRWLKAWMNFCERYHNACARREPLTGEPSSIRLIDVINKCLVTSDLHEQFVALSYVWGKDVAGLVTIATESKFQQEGSLSKVTVPEIVSDAMELVAELGLRYIWIDTACIIQDDVVDKQQQLPIMDLIYSHAKLVIVADVESANSRLPRWKTDFDRVKPPLEKIHDVLFTTGEINLENVMKKSLWNTRGWTLQESLLGKRKLIFTKTQVHWECCEEAWCEDRVLEFARYCNLPTDESSLITWSRKEACGNTTTKAYKLCAMGEYTYRATAFSERQFTNGNDAFWAFAGILRSIRHNFPKGYIWGLPYDNLDAALLWRPDCASDRCYEHTIRHKDGIFSTCPIPSWCWISKGCNVNYESCGDTLESLVKWHEPLRYPEEYRFRNCPKHSISQTPYYIAEIPSSKNPSSELFDYGLLHFTAQATNLRVQLMERPKVESSVDETQTGTKSASLIPSHILVSAHIRLNPGQNVGEMLVPYGLFAGEPESICEFILLSKNNEKGASGSDETSHPEDDGPHTPECRHSARLNIMLIVWHTNFTGAQIASRVALGRIDPWAWEKAGAKEKDIILG